MIDERERLQAALAKSETDLADAERLQQRQGYGKELSPADDPQPYIDRLREFRDVRQKALRDWELRNEPTVVTSKALGTGATSQEQRVRSAKT
jgi:hypothetical protein